MDRAWAPCKCRGAAAVLLLAIVCAAAAPGARAAAEPLSQWSRLQKALRGFWPPHATGFAGDDNKSQRVPDFNDIDDGSVKSHWALLIAGSNGWWNYRHQADVCHAYQVMLSGGLRPERIVVMIYDDIASDAQNPLPGQIFNRPDGPDVYDGVKVDYRGAAVNAQTVLAVLEGNKSVVAKKGSGKVIASGPNDRVFVFYSDHGSPGVLGMPTGPFLYADELHAAIKRKHEARGYKEMTMYVEACESGSMFEGLLGPELNVYATTASNAEESSWGCYCPGMDRPAGEGIDTCLGDLYSVSWMEDGECEDTTAETLGAQYELVRLRTSHNNTYEMGSHVMQYGRMGMQPEHTGSYIGIHNASACQMPSSRRVGSALQRQHTRHSVHSVPQREADLVPLRMAVARARTPEERLVAQTALDAVVHKRQQIDAGAAAAVRHLLLSREASPVLLASLGWSRAQVFAATSGAGASASNALTPNARYVTELLTSSTLMGRGDGSGRPLVDSWDCLRGMVAAYSAACGGQYAMRHTRLFANLCNAGLAPRQLKSALVAAKACPAVAVQPAAVGAA